MCSAQFYLENIYNYFLPHVFLFSSLLTSFAFPVFFMSCERNGFSLKVVQILLYAYINVPSRKVPYLFQSCKMKHWKFILHLEYVKGVDVFPEEFRHM